VWAVPRFCGFYPGICLTTEEKARKNLSQGSRRAPAGTMKMHKHAIRIHRHIKQEYNHIYIKQTYIHYIQPYIHFIQPYLVYTFYNLIVLIVLKYVIF